MILFRSFLNFPIPGLKKKVFLRKGYGKQNPVSRKTEHAVHISNVNWNSTKSDWIEYLKCGEDRTKGFYLELPLNRNNRDQNLGWCNVYFPTSEQVYNVIDDLDGARVFGRNIRVEERKDMSKNTTSNHNTHEHSV